MVKVKKMINRLWFLFEFHFDSNKVYEGFESVEDVEEYVDEIMERRIRDELGIIELKRIGDDIGDEDE